VKLRVSPSGATGGRLGWWWVVGDGWYYCSSAVAYDPYVAACPEGWTPVVPQ
jgi:hypothetical protein